jgi:hypothetical protein
MGGSTMHFVDDEYLLLSRSGRTSPGLGGGAVRAHAKRARHLEAARLARLSKPPGPLVVRLPSGVS